MASLDKDQMELIQRAFAHDDVEAEFELEKKKAIEDQLPKEELDLNLPGWGSWGGKGIEWKPRPKDLKKIKEREKKEEELRKKRKDARLAHVIINENRDTKWKNTGMRRYRTLSNHVKHMKGAFVTL